MRNHIAFKFLAILLATLCLLTVVFSTVGIGLLIESGLYSSTLDEIYEDQTYYERRSFAIDLVYTYATLNLGGIPEEYYEQYFGYEWESQFFHPGYYYYSIFDDNGVMVESTVDDSMTNILENADFYEIHPTDIVYRRIINDPSELTSGSVFDDDYFDAENECYVHLLYQQETLNGYTVQLYLLDGAYIIDAYLMILQQLYSIRYHLFWILGAAALIFISVMIYLCSSAGRKPGSDEIRAGGINRLPLDLYTAACGGLILLLLALGFELEYAIGSEMSQLLFYLLLMVGAAGCLIAVGLIFSWAAQLKMPDRYWMKNTIIGRLLRLVFGFFQWLGRGMRRLFMAMHSLFRLLPVIWQWLLTAAMMLIVPLLFILFANWAWYPWDVFWAVLFFLSLFADMGVILYGAYCFGILMKGAKRMSHGQLDAKISTKYLVGSFRDFALNLNALSDVISQAAEKQTRSERMKTELITNVSHDIKTPLTSIINFVDLLQKPHSEAEQAEYLDVLSRQSAQMKKLIEDLMELSKANSGNLNVNLQKVDAVEAVNQALGEFSDKLESAGLTPVFRQPEQPVYITADGRHVWRVLFNLLTNAVKYALPGTRLYIDLMRADRNVVLSIKNVSRAELNISADELMERFVQGDASRKTEGSGLGLNIAKSLMEVQHGQLQLLLDGDLFKVTLIFAAAE